MSLLQPIDRDIWIHAGPLRRATVDLGRNLVAVRLPSGSLALITPCRHSPALQSELESHGPIRHLVANNRFHNLFLTEWLEALPGATCHAVRGFKEQYSLRVDRILGVDAAPTDFAAVFSEYPIAGMPKVEECLLLHRPSRSLIVGDLLFNLQRRQGPIGAVLTRLLGIAGGPARGRMYSSFIRDRPAFEQSLTAALNADFTRILMAHGAPITSAAQATLRRTWALD